MISHTQSAQQQVSTPDDLHDRVDRLADTLGLVAGGGLLLFGLTRRSIPGLALAIAGAALLSECGDRFVAQLQALQAEPERRDQTPTDEVEEASMESFPASDAPGHGGGNI